MTLYSPYYTVMKRFSATKGDCNLHNLWNNQLKLIYKYLIMSV